MSDKRRTYENLVPGVDFPRLETDERTPEQVAQDIFYFLASEQGAKILHNPLLGTAELAKSVEDAITDNLTLIASRVGPHDYDDPLPPDLDDALQRILDATIAAGGKLIPDF